MRLKTSKRIHKFLQHVKTAITVFFICILSIIIFDFILGRYWEFGYQSRSVEQDITRYPTPYDMFRGKPHTKDYNQYGFRGSFTKVEDLAAQEITIAFFGGSTGHNGRPPIAGILKKLAAENGLNLSIYNFSSVSSHHSQHLHRLIEFLPLYSFDMVIFYGGFNETAALLNRDPRPGYPFNFYMRNETNPLLLALMKYSAIIGEFDKRTGLLSGKRKLEKALSDSERRQAVVARYRLDIEMAKQITEAISKPHACQRPQFVSIFQPSLLKNRAPKTQKSMQKESANLVIAHKDSHFDLSHLAPKLKFRDYVHVDQKSRRIIAEHIWAFIFPLLVKNCSS